ncbi:hypothetical protein P171DRAFT_36696 [Karstenula rhodostoma CBS 690.94]|uniref:Uncharacterized protein n=1 Tax=Karstenula rhodostoma CBS 690.94 TaxID=1392251 RepID=A0A9P4UAL5_9PLEO|nr:hypothetical protein P171DRAFT_36696 [Karstenula rhodostoma CBS 690.94]
MAPTHVHRGNPRLRDDRPSTYRSGLDEREVRRSYVQQEHVVRSANPPRRCEGTSQSRSNNADGRSRAHPMAHSEDPIPERSRPGEMHPVAWRGSLSAYEEVSRQADDSVAALQAIGPPLSRTNTGLYWLHKRDPLTAGQEQRVQCWCQRCSGNDGVLRSEGYRARGDIGELSDIGEYGRLSTTASS